MGNWIGPWLWPVQPPLSYQAGLPDLARISAVVSGEQVIDRSRPPLHPLSPLLGGGLEAAGLSFVADDRRPMADEVPLPGRRPVAGQHVPQSRMAPPPSGRCLVAAVDTGLTAALTRRLIWFILPPAEHGPACTPQSAGHGEDANRRRP
jgi:hypothetical protein